MKKMPNHCLEVGMQNSGLASGIAKESGKIRATLGWASAVVAPFEWNIFRIYFSICLAEERIHRPNSQKTACSRLFFLQLHPKDGNIAFHLIS